MRALNTVLPAFTGFSTHLVGFENTIHDEHGAAASNSVVTQRHVLKEQRRAVQGVTGEQQYSLAEWHVTNTVEAKRLCNLTQSRYAATK